MTTPFIEELALISKNNEAISEVFRLTEVVDGLPVPIDLTGREFFAQARRGKSKEAELMCDIEAQPYGDPTEGLLHVFVSDEVMNTVSPGKGYYDILTRAGPTAPTDNLYMAPFVVEGGVTQWT